MKKYDRKKKKNRYENKYDSEYVMISNRTYRDKVIDEDGFERDIL